MESRRSLDRARQRASRFPLGETRPGAMLRRTCGKIGMIAAAVLATWGPAAAEVLEVRSGAARLGLDGATGALLRFADPEAGLELAGGGQDLFRLVVIPPGADPGEPLRLSSPMPRR